MSNVYKTRRIVGAAALTSLLILVGWIYLWPKEGIAYFICSVPAQCSIHPDFRKERDSAAMLDKVFTPLKTYSDFVTENFRYLVEEKGVSIEDIRFNSPEQLELLSDGQVSIFDNPHYSIKAHTSALERQGAKSLDYVMEDGREAIWYYNAELALYDGFPDRRDAADHPKKNISDVMAFLPGIKKEHCQGHVKLRSDQKDFIEKQMINDGISDYVVPKEPRPYLDALIMHPSCLMSHDGAEYIYVFQIYDRK